MIDQDQHSRLPVQIVGVVGTEGDDGLYVLASDGSIFRYATYKDLRYWDQLEALPNDPPEPGEVDSTRHALLCDALRQLGSIEQRTTQEVVTHCRAVVPDADSDEILAAVRTVGRGAE